MGRSDEEILGRDDIDDVEFLAFLAQSNTDADDLAHEVTNNADTMFTWDYAKGTRPRLERLYEKAKQSQWNGRTDLPWHIEVDPEKLFDQDIIGSIPPTREQLAAPPFSPVKNWSDSQWSQLATESVRWRLSQFLHGEQGALVCTAKIVETVPWIDAKYYAATQVVDEARHVEVFGRYLSEKMGGEYPINVHLRMLLDDIIEDSRWDMTYLGMQIMVEGLALAAFGMMRQTTAEPLLKELLRYVMSDEARHVAFGVLSLQEVYGELSTAEIRERQEFCFEASVRMRDRFLQQEVWEAMGIDSTKMAKIVLDLPSEGQLFQQLLFSKIVPNCKKLGLLDGGDGWLRTKFTEMGVIGFEDMPTTEDELDEFDLNVDEPSALQGSVAADS